MTWLEACSVLEAAGIRPGDLNMSEVAAAALAEALRRDWAVRVLDAWARPNFGAMWWVRKEVGFIATIHWPDARDFREFGKFDTEDNARLAAAEAVWPELPESVRAELGERP